MKVKVNIDYSRYNTQERRDKAQLVENEMQLILRSNKFKENFINLLSLRDYQEGELSIWASHSPEEIYNYLMDGSEILTPELDCEIDIVLDDYYTWKRVIGYTYKNTNIIYSNTKYLDSYSSKEVGSNYIHEYGHKKGFDHDFRNTARRADSLCYLLNIAYEKTWEDMFGDDTSPSDKVLECFRTWCTLWLFKKCNWVQV